MQDQPTERQCSRCGETKALSEFAKNAGRCRACHREYSREWRAKNLEKVRAQARAYVDRNRERLNAQAREARASGERLEAERAYRERNRDKLREKGQAWADANRARVREQKRAWAARNPDEVRRTRREGMARRKALLPLTNYATTDPLARDYMALLRCDPCAYCGGPGGTVDHINPIHVPGADDLQNLTGACKACNATKSKRPLLQFLLAEGGDAYLHR